MFNPAVASENIKREFIDYISTSYSFADQDLQKQLVAQLEQNISKGPYLEIKDAFKSGKSIRGLIDNGTLSPLFLNLEAKKPINNNLYKTILPIDRPLYLHQEQAIRAIVNGKNVVISTGTGSGKTNCFLIPVINQLLREQETGTLGPGVRAMFIYPMNALANDQLKNIRNILMCYPDITFGVYTGATESDEDRAISVYKTMFANEELEELKHPLPNEILSRNEMKKTPPNILFTNYAMLEHLLFRPKDDVIFSDADFRFVVLDEAHVYTGATGIETSILLRRLRARITSKKETQFILTSATLGSDASYDKDIVTFAENLCGVPFDKGSIIRATREEHLTSNSTHHYPPELYKELAKEENIVSKVLDSFGIPHDDSKKEQELLYDLTSTSDLYAIMRNNISEVTSLDFLKKFLGVDLETAIAFISLCTRSVKNGKCLIDARYHYFVRSLEGCYIALSPDKKLFLSRQHSYTYKNTDYAVFEVASCDECGKLAIVGNIKGSYLVQSSIKDLSTDYFYIEDEDNQDIEEDNSNDDENTQHEDIKAPKYLLCPHCGAIAEQDINFFPCNCPGADLIHLRKAKSDARCGNCHSGTYQRFYLGNDAATSVLATSLYEELPELEVTSNIISPKQTSIFSKKASEPTKEKKKTIRQFLVFSDSRQEAAKFACYLGKSYEEFLRRRGIYQIIKAEQDNITKFGYSISDFVTKLSNYFDNKKSFASSNTDDSKLTTRSNRNAWVALLNELARYNSSTSLTSLGILQFHYLGNTDEIIHNVAVNYNVPDITIRNLLDLLAFEIVKAGAIVANSDSDISDTDREYIFYTPSQQYIKLQKSPTEDFNSISSWMPKAKKGKEDEYYRSNKIYYVCKMLNRPQKDAAYFLKDYFEYLTNDTENDFCMISPNKDGSYVMPARNFEVLIPGSKDAKWYRCKKCGKISQFNINGHCQTVRCDGLVDEIEPSTVGKENHFVHLYTSDKMSPLFIKEHTAQLSKRESAEYQQEFIKKSINALSCSTTFEMGVDVGDLETVFLRNVPPLPSNYAQRAGRAGRSINAAAYALTYAKLSSHDLSFYKNPVEMIRGTILPPLFKIDNEKIIRRHVYAVALSLFFSLNEDQYNHNDAEVFINNKGYKLFISWLNTKPESLKNLLLKSIPDTNNLHNRIGLNDFSWIESFSGEDGAFTQLITEYENNIKDFETIIKKYAKEEDLDNAAKCKKRLEAYKKNQLIEFLARGNILPRYGFPVDTVELEQFSSTGSLSKLRLSRDLQVAIAEYAPSSEIIADGHMYTSRYIKKAPIDKNKQDWHIAYIGKCPNENCGTMNISLTPIPKSGVTCFACGEKIGYFDFYPSIEPKNGFVAEDKVKEVPMTKQEKNYRTDDFYIGNKAAKTIDKYFFSFNDIYVKVESTTNDSLMTKTTKSFYVCPKCGYSVAEDESIGDRKAEAYMKSQALTINMSKSHKNLFGQHFCDCKTLNKRSLHHIFNTDVAKISFGCSTSNYSTMISVMYAILYSICHELNIERKDLKACLSLKIKNGRKCYSIIIYDAVPGGAGHSRRLVTDNGELLKMIFEKAYKRMTTCNCDPSCYNCLRSYENQKLHDLLDRNLAASFLGHLLGNVTVVDETDDSLKEYLQYL